MGRFARSLKREEKKGGNYGAAMNERTKKDEYNKLLEIAWHREVPVDINNKH